MSKKPKRRVAQGAETAHRDLLADTVTTTCSERCAHHAAVPDAERLVAYLSCDRKYLKE